MAEKENNFGAAVTKLRTDLKLSMREVAKGSKDGDKEKGLSQGYISLIEAGKVSAGSLTVEKVLALARGMNVSPMLLFALAVGVKQRESKLLHQILEFVRALPVGKKKDVLSIAEMYVKQLAVARTQPKEEFIDVEVKEEDVRKGVTLGKRKKLVNGQK